MILFTLSFYNIYIRNYLLERDREKKNKYIVNKNFFFFYQTHIHKHLQSNKNPTMYIN